MSSILTRGNKIFDIPIFFALVSRHSAVLDSNNQYAISPEFGGKWGMECLNTLLPLPTLLCTEYDAKKQKSYYVKKD